MDNNNEKNTKLRELIKDMRFAMLTTIEEDVKPPNGDSEFDFDGDLWFFTWRVQVDEIKHNQHNNVSC